MWASHPSRHFTGCATEFSVALSDVGAEDVDAAFKVRPARLIVSAEPHDVAPLVNGICPMRNLYVGHARLDQGLEEGVSAALSAWFPELERVRGLLRPGECTAEELARMGFESDEAAGLYWRWGSVERAIPRYVRVRKQEQRWAMQQKTSVRSGG